jgi:hypothetical protein
MRINAYDHSDHVVNTTNGPVPVPKGDRGEHVVNTSRIVEEDLVYTDEEPEIISVVPATGWHAVLGAELVPLVAFVGMDSGQMYGVVVDEDGLIDLTRSVEDRESFAGYRQANETKEI